MPKIHLPPCNGVQIGFRIVPKPAPGHYFHSLGYASKPHITVNYSRREEVASRTLVPLDTILGCVVAHELSRLLLRPNSHAPTGIMAGQRANDGLMQICEMFIGFEPLRRISCTKMSLPKNSGKTPRGKPPLL